VFTLAKQLCKVAAYNLDSLLKNNELAEGSLVRFSIEDGQASPYYFVGALYTRPLLHVLIECAVDGDAKIILHVVDGLAQLCTSQQAVHKLLQDYGCAPGTALQCSVFKYQFDHASLRTVWRVGAIQLITSLSTARKSTKPKKRKRADVALPFGLKMPRAPRKSRKTKGGSGAKVDIGMPDGLAGSPCSSTASDSESDSSSESASSSSEFSSSTPSAPDAFSDDGSVEDAGDPKVVLTSAEKKHVHELLKHSTPPGPPLSGKSFFYAKLGAFDVTRAKSNRAKCHFCLGAIAKDSLRVDYAYSAYKPEKGVHIDCISEIPLEHLGNSIQSLLTRSENPMKIGLLEDVELEACVKACITRLLEVSKIKTSLGGTGSAAASE
jgi:hypothetical protein